MDKFVRRMKHYVEIGEAELDTLLALEHRNQTFSPGQTIVALNEPMKDIYIVRSGWSLRTRYLDDGRRQIINFQLPGDYFDLMSLVGARADHTITAATETTLRLYDGGQFLQLIQETPRLASAFWWVTVQEETILRQQIVRIGRMSARERIADFILELNRRQTIAEGQRNDFVPLPVPQAYLADALGLSVVHISRSLTAMKSKDMLHTSRRGIQIVDRAAMMELAEYNPALLEPHRVSIAAQ
ncbi:MAG: Crp/Fnr family transcriptional regulator [Pseudomonadota bacterium]